MTEQRQREKFIEILKGSIFKDFELYCEVPVFCRSVDLVILNKNDKTITAVEFKVKNWKKAIEQAVSVAISFDFLEVCMVQPKTDKGKQVIINQCEQLGIGLYFTSSNEENFQITHPVIARPVEKIWVVQKQSIIEYLERCVSFAH